MDELPNKDSANEIRNDQTLINSDNTKTKTIFKIFGVEMVAPKGLNNAGAIYIFFIGVNLFLLFALKGLLGN